MPIIGNAIYQAAFVTDTFSGTGSKTVFTMSVAPAGTTNVLVAVSGVLQDPATYGVVGNTLTFSGAPPSGTGNISCRYLGVPVTGVTTTAYRTVTEFTATASQTTFTPPSYTVGFINVYRNGVLLGSADYTATNGTTVVLTAGATAGDLVTVESFLVSSVLNAIPNTAGSVGSSNLAGGSVTQAKLGTNVAGNGPAFSAYGSAPQTVSNETFTKVTLDVEEFDTNSNFASSRFTPTVAGYYQINGQVSGVGTVSLSRTLVTLYKNGATYKYGSDGTITRSMISCVVYMNGTTDYLELYGLLVGTGTMSFGGASQADNYFNGSMIRSV